jgi:hypothetical protein
MDKEINKFIKHTIVNLEGALMKDDDKLTLAVLYNLSDTIDSYIEALELLAVFDKVGGSDVTRSN